MRRRGSMLGAFLLLCGGCGGPVEVAGPFYLDEFADTGEVALLRCPDGPGGPCAIDGLPGPPVIAAGASDRFVAVRTARAYFYFERVAEERRGYGDNPERIVGPLDESAFAAAKARLGLPELDVRP